jgi:anaerobic selenocysteine-containing dehydrogenase
MINMNTLGDALTELNDPPVKALFIYNCNAAAVAPDSTRVLAGLRRPDLFTIVHEQFFTDTTDYADILLPATTFLEHKEVMGAYGHLYAQISTQAIEPLGEARSNVALFSQLGLRMGFAPADFDVTEDSLIAEALDTTHPWFAGITPERLEREKQIHLQLPQNSEGATLPFSTPEWFPRGRASLLPVPEFIPAVESPSHPSADRNFPLQFLPRKADNFMNTTFANLAGHQQMERRTAGILEIHATDAASRNILHGDEVSVFNSRGRITLTASVGVNGNTRVAPGVVAARLDWHKLSTGGANVNALTSQRLTDIGGGATFYSTMVEVARSPDAIEA